MLNVLAEGATSVGSTVNAALQTNVQPSSIVDEFVALLPWVGAMVLVAFVIYEARKLAKGAGKGKVKC